MMLAELPKVERKALNAFNPVTITSRKAFNLKTEAEKVAHWKAIDRKRNRWIVGITRMIRSVFRDELKQIRESVKNSLTPNTMIESVLDDVRRNKDAWATALKNIYLPVGKSIAEDVVDGLKHKCPKQFKALDPETEFFVDPFILDYLEKASALKVVGITDTTRNRLQAALSEGVAEGESIEKLAKRIDKLYLESIIPNRSAVIARTEVIQASNLGSMAAAKSTNIPGLKKTWLTTRDTRARDAHLSIDGETIDIDAAFVLSTGSRLMFPADSSLGAAAGDVIECRCTQFFEGEDEL